MKLHTAWVGALALPVMILAGCSGSSDVSVRITEKENRMSGVVNAVVVITAEKDAVAIKKLKINGGDCPILYKEHKSILNTGQQNTYTLGQDCRLNDVARVDVETENGPSSFTF